MYLPFFLDLGAGNSDLHKAVTEGQEATAFSFLNQGADSTTPNSRGETPLHIAFHKNLPRVVEKILANYKNFVNNVTDNNGLSCLHIASSVRGKIGIASLQHFMKIGANVNQRVSYDSKFHPGNTALHFAAQWGKSQNVHALLEHGAKYSLQNKSNGTAFDLALPCAEFVQQPSAYDVMREIVWQDMQTKDLHFIDYGFTPLHLLETGATPRYINEICAMYKTTKTHKT
ncbi:hypothetical protein QAD02_002910 [Eretmocerus hayati]|uniref:Uncharacterized protein n=1 Tax=Eretmocerus hayati TaxID=131215 RepID=A0ACC2NM07_9HYME|nr:hypothetical protein QAD02_002910 [Eretmocerus hayati]